MRAAASAEGSSSSTHGPTNPPIFDCPSCCIQLVRIRSKKRETYGQTFVKCPNNIKDDPTTCGFILSEVQYEYYCREQWNKRQKKANPSSAGDGAGDGGTDAIPVASIVGLKEELNELKRLKEKIDGVVSELSILKVEVQTMKIQYVVIAAVCVGVACGCCVMNKVWN